ncbi:MAG: peroxiredoxin [Moraxellaceae bacterium]|nr:MAG: peroxiredoxin [Moraxellaceae bacterium]
MTISQVPSVTFQTRVRDETIEGDNPFRWQEVTSEELFSNKKVVLFALPGAFTPTCSSSHLPGYEEKYQQLIDLGVDNVICLSVNDAFTMFQWAKAMNIKSVAMLPDGNAQFTRLMGMLVKKENLGFGGRSWRYSMVVNNGRVEKIFSEPGIMDNCPEDPFTCSDVDTMLEYLRAS